MAIQWNSDGSIWAHDIFSASDYNTIASFYNNLLGINIGSLGSGHILTHDDMNNIRNAVLSKSGDYNIPGNFPGAFYSGQIWPALTWSPTSYKYREWTYTGNGEFWVPAGVHGINVVMIVAGGGGGGFGTNQEYGGSGGSGGSGGWYQNYHLNVNPGDHVQIYIGGGGRGSYRIDTAATGQNGPYGLATSDSTSGGDSFITVNGNEVLRVTGGGRGIVAAPNGEGGQGGYAGSPNGSSGGQGTRGRSHYSGHGTYAGPNGANSPWGQGGQGGIASGQNTNPAINAGSASGYGAGGGGGGTCANTGWYFTWTGGDGSPGKCVIGLPG